MRRSGGVDRRGKKRMIGARDEDHLENFSFAPLREFAFERKIDGVPKTAVFHQVLNAITADQNLVFLNG